MIAQLRQRYLLGRAPAGARRRHRRARAGARRRNRWPLPWSLRPRPPRAVVVIVLVALLALAGGAFLWLRDSSLVAVDRVSVSGESGPDAGQIRSALIAAARNMTTLDVNMDELRMAVGPFPVVKDLRVSTQFPHGMRIRVIEQVPVGAIVVGGRTIAVAGDGTLLHDVVASPSLPAIPLRVPPGGFRLSDRDALAAVAVLAAAPYQLLARVSEVSTISQHGLVAQLRSGPSIYFGDQSRLVAKWIAASAVLAAPGSAGAVYIDVTDPEHPAAGGVQPAAGGASTASGGYTTASGAAPAIPSVTPASATPAAGSTTTPGG